MGIRNGSTVTVVTAELGGAGGANGSLSGDVVDISDGYIVLDLSGTTTVLPWHSIRQVVVTAY